jgi:hypothetical protein
MEIRASIRRKATSRKSVQEGSNDRLADQLEQAALMLRQQAKEIDELRNFISLDKNRAKEWFAYELDNEIKRFKESEIKQLKATRLEYAEAVYDALISWGCYASDYFQQKWGYQEEVAKWQNTIKTLREASEK